MAKKTVIKSKPRKVIEFGKYGATKEKTIQEVQEIGTFRREQPGLFGILTGMTTYVIIFMLLLFGTSAVHYQNNQESLSWIDANGEFKTETYNVTVSYNLDTPLDELNGYSLNAVFNDNNEYNNGIGYTGLSLNQETDLYYKFKTASTSGSAVFVRPDIDYTSAQGDYIWHNVSWSVNDTSYFYRYYTGSWTSSTFVNTTDIQTDYIKKQFVGNVTFRFSIRDIPLLTDWFIYKDDLVYINMSELGFENLTEDEMNYWYSEYQSLQVNMLEDLKTLGAMPLASWNTINEVTRTLIDVYEFGMKLVFPVVDVVRRLISLV